MIEELSLTDKSRICTLTTECVIHLHQLLSENYHLIDKMDPVEPPGVKNHTILESAVFRQKIGSGDWLKYGTIFKNCATLVFGLVKNHPFHNGNKRVAFLAMIKHLFENGYVIKADSKHDDIYYVLLALADNKLEKEIEKIDKSIYNRYRKIKKVTDDIHIEVLSDWIRKISESKTVSIKSKLKITQLKDILAKKDIHIDLNGTFITLFQLQSKRVLGVIPSGKIRVNEKTYGLGNSKTEIGIKVILQIRKDYNLTHADGFDTKTFYDSESFIDNEMITYKRIIYKLSQT